MMSYDNWLEDPYAKKWLDELGERTRKNCIAEFPSWLDFIRMSPTEMIEKRLKDIQSSNPIERAFFEDKVKAFKRFLETKGLKASTIHSKLNRVQSFFAHNNLKLSFAKGDLAVEPTEQEKFDTKWMPNNMDIRLMYKHGTIRDRALLLVLYQSGLSEVDVSQINIEYLNHIYEHEGHLYISKLREKTNIKQQTCISSEAVEDIQAMLKERGSPTEGALFVSQKGERLTVRFINEAMKKLCEKALPSKAKEFKTKNLRDSYHNALLRSKLPQELKDSMFGHQRQGARKHYQIAPQTIIEAYEQAFQYLTINHGTKEKVALTEIKENMGQLAELIAEQRQKIKELSDRLALLDDALAHHRNEEIREIYEEIKKDMGIKIERNTETLMKIVKFLRLDKET